MCTLYDNNAVNMLLDIKFTNGKLSFFLFYFSFYFILFYFHFSIFRTARARVRSDQSTLVTKLGRMK